MSVKIRLRRMGGKKKPFYRFVAIDSRMARDGRFVDMVGYYDPMTNPPKIHVDEPALFKWLDRGATPSVNVASLLRRVGALQKWELAKAGLKGEELDTRVEAIKARRVERNERIQAKKVEAKTAKGAAKGEAEKHKTGAGDAAASEGAKSDTPPAES
jgi:small subunit ribosomal protein S16